MKIQTQDMAKVMVWYDGACPLCIREIAFMRRLDSRGCIDFQNAALPSTVCPLDRQLMLSRFHASEDGIILSGAAAFAAMWRAIPMLRPLGLAARSRMILFCLEGFYRAFLLVRPAVQRLFGAVTEGKPE